jgi:hypothetical protein
MKLSTTFKSRRAVLISGGISPFQNYARYLNDLTIFYDCLVSGRYGFQPQDIQVLFAQGGAYPMGGALRNTQHATRANVQAAIQSAVAASGDDDLLVVMTTNHGDAGPPHRLLLWDPAETLTAQQFGAELAKRQSDFHFLGVFGHCFGDEMFNESLAQGAAGRAVVVAASDTASYSLGPDHAYDAFLYHFVSAIRGQTPQDYPADSDTNADGQVDVQEAFDFARKMDKTKDNPQIDDNDPAGNPRLATRMTLEGLL